MTEKKFINLICFLVLMENNGGIINKEPSYILEKLDRANQYGFYNSEGSMVYGLDSHNEMILKDYFQKWRLQVLNNTTKL